MKKISKKFGHPIDIEWFDACNYSEWKTIEEATSADLDVHCVTRAFFVGQDEHYITVAHTIGKNTPAEDDVCGVMKIPKGMVIKVK